MAAVPRYMVSVNPLRMLAALLRERGVVVEELLARHGIDAEAFDDLEARVPLEVALALWDDAARILEDDHVGLSVGARAPIGDGVLAYAVQAAPTLADAYRLVMRFHRLIADVVRPRLVEKGHHVWLMLDAPPVDPALLRHWAELYLAKIVYGGRELTRVNWSPLAVRFRHAAPARLDAYRRFFRGPIEFGAPANELELDATVMQLRVQTAEPRLLHILERYAADALARLPPANELVMTLRLVIATSLGLRQPTIARLAEQMRMSPRTLQRQLAAAGLSLRDLIEDARHELARRNRLLQPDTPRDV